MQDDDCIGMGFVLWITGKARALIDADGGTFGRFRESGTKLNDLDLIG